MLLSRRVGFAHRDLKPHNVLLTADGRAKLCDMGIAARAVPPAGGGGCGDGGARRPSAGPRHGGLAPPHRRLTSPSWGGDPLDGGEDVEDEGKVGTLAYMPPEALAPPPVTTVTPPGNSSTAAGEALSGEALSGEAVADYDARCWDCYSLGVVLWQLWHRDDPWGGFPAHRVASRVSRGKRPPTRFAEHTRKAEGRDRRSQSRGCANATATAAAAAASAASDSNTGDADGGAGGVCGGVCGGGGGNGGGGCGSGGGAGGGDDAGAERGGEGGRASPARGQEEGQEKGLGAAGGQAPTEAPTEALMQVSTTEARGEAATEGGASPQAKRGRRPVHFGASDGGPPRGATAAASAPHRSPPPPPELEALWEGLWAQDHAARLTVKDASARLRVEVAPRLAAPASAAVGAAAGADPWARFWPARNVLL